MEHVSARRVWRRRKANFTIGLIAAMALLGAILVPGMQPSLAAPGSDNGKPNKDLQASFRADCDELTCIFIDGTRSHDTLDSWEWDFADGTWSTGRDVIHTFPAGGTYDVTLTVTDVAGDTASKSKRIKVREPNAPAPEVVPPVAAFGVTCDGLSCVFEDQSTDDGAVVGWAWGFGDGATGTERHPDHVYAAAGTYTVSLTVTDDTGASGDTEAAVTVEAPPPPPPPPAGEGLPFGVFFQPDESWGVEFSGGFLTVTPKTIVRDLDMVRAAGASVVLNLVGKKETHQNPDETINVDMWKAEIDEYAGIDLSSYVADGTLLAHYMTDEPKSRGSWGYEIVHNEDIDEMARYSKTLWPYLPTTVRVSPSKLTRHAGGYDVLLPDWEWQYLDIAWAQYSARFGSVVEYTAIEIAEADRQGLGLVFGLNVIDGGDGSSGVPGVRSGKWSMSAQELRDYAGTLIGSDGACTFLMWRYDWNGYVYFDRPDIHEAVTELAALAASRNSPRCRLR